MKTPTPDEMRAMFRVHTEAALNVIVDIMTNGTGAKGEAIRLAAAKEVLNRGWGRPTTHKDKEAADADAQPEWRNREGKTYEQLYREKAAEVAAEAAARAAATSPEVAALKPEPAPTPPGVAPSPAAATRQSDRQTDPTGYIARRALWSASPPPQGQRGSRAVAPDQPR